MSPVTNSFAVDYGAGEHIIDINNPPRKNYNPHAPENQFPRALYHHETGRILHVENEKEMTAALKRNFELKPAPGRDYSKISMAGIAAEKTKHEPREEEMSAAELAALDEAAELETAPEDTAIPEEHYQPTPRRRSAK